MVNLELLAPNYEFSFNEQLIVKVESTYSFRVHASSDRNKDTLSSFLAFPFPEELSPIRVLCVRGSFFAAHGRVQTIYFPSGKLRNGRLRYFFACSAPITGSMILILMSLRQRRH